MFEGDANDASVHGYHGTIQDSPTFITGKNSLNSSPGQAISLDGIDDYILIQERSAFELQTFTILAWVRPQDFSVSIMDIFSTAEAKPGISNGMAFRIINDPGVQQVTFAAANVTHWFTHTSTSPDTLTAEIWNHVAITYNGRSTTFYLNGTSLTTNNVTNSDENIPIIYNPSIHPKIGTSAEDISNEFGYFKGDIDELMIFNRALTPEQIQSIHEIN